MKTRFYAAYGSNLCERQMKTRCADAERYGTATLKHWAPVFRGCLTIEPRFNAVVPLGIWTVSDDDLERLDRYEGYPNYYEKTTLRLHILNERTGQREWHDCLVYIMQPGYPQRRVTPYYYGTCAEGYADFGFDEEILQKALREAVR